ncbi:hypothetical protein J3R83DRAFT_7146 [Lanmaoa asiatica]|nr:hypothetical protein J3R83DRAFT_7146 [Lanmaoa asiatica]
MRDHNWAFLRTGHQNAFKTYEFSLSSSEGALLILPEGAESYNLLKRKIFRDAATQNGVDWYNFAEQQLGRIITHDSLYLITGCYKSHSWSVAAFHEASSQTGATEFPAQFKAGQAGQGNISAAYTWETMRALHWRVGPLGDWTPIPNQAVFISGFKIAIRDNILGRKRVEVEVDTSPTRLKATKVFSGDKGHSRAGKLWRRLVSPKSGGNKEAGEQIEAGPVNDSGTDLAPDNMDVCRRVTSFHPSDIINKYLLSKVCLVHSISMNELAPDSHMLVQEPSATVAVTHDSQWSVLLQKGILKPEDLGQRWPVRKHSVVCLQPISDSSIRLTDIDDAVREAWKENKMDDAEEILSMQIIRRKGADYSALANRALIRARSHHWDAALRDAETSIDIQPSVTAHIAKGFALFGQQKHTSALHAFNVALHECDGRDKVLVSLVKSIVLFEVGYHAESIASIADLIEHCPVELKSACSAAQAEIYVRLATLANKNEDYDRTLQHLTRAQSFGPFHAVPELAIISLICGWRFDNIQFSAHQQKCEALYVAGRISEAVESLRTMTSDLGEDVRGRQDNARWITTFTQQCLKSLESLGDSALASQNYTEAITHYSEVLSMGPTAPEGILVKRSNAHAAVYAWNDALNDADEAITLNPLSPWGHERKLAALQGLGRHDEAIQAFSSMLSTLERFADPHTQELRSGDSGPAMAIQRIDPRLQTHRNYPPRRNLDHKLLIESIMTATQDVDSRRVTDVLEMLRGERDEMVRERSALPSAGQPEQPEQPLDVVDEAAGTSLAASNVRLSEQMATERYQKLRDQLTDLVRQNQEDDKQAPQWMKMMLQLAEQQLVPRPQRDEPTNIPGKSRQVLLRMFELLDELHIYNAKQRELLDALSSHWTRGETGKGKQQGKDGGTDREQLPSSFRSLREDFIKALATEAQKIVEEIARLGEERRWLQQEIGQLMTMRSKYGPGGEFDPDWRPLPPPPPPPPPPPLSLEKISMARSQKEPTRFTAPPLPTRAKSIGPENTQISRPAWRSVKPVVKQKRPESTVERIRHESDNVGLFGPSTPRETFLLDVEPALEPNPISPEAASKTSPPEALPLKPGHHNPILFSPLGGPLPNPSLNRSSPKSDTSSAPSPLSFTLPPLEASESKIPEKLASHIDTFAGAKKTYDL